MDADNAHAVEEPTLVVHENLVAAEPTIQLRRVDPSRNMARYYALSVELTLFEDWSCTRSFGRIGAKGGRILVGCTRRAKKPLAQFGELLKRKKAKGYREPSRSHAPDASLLSAPRHKAVELHLRPAGRAIAYGCLWRRPSTPWRGDPAFGR